MKAISTKLKGCFVIEPTIFNDNRGYFCETYNQKDFNELIEEKINFVQDNQSYSVKGVVRALHYQEGKYAQAKLVRVVMGRVLDVALDLRINAPTFGEHIAIELSAENHKQMFIPKGFAHGFSVLSEEAILSYKCDEFYHKKSEKGIIYNDKTLDIDWGLDEENIIISEKDKLLPTFKELF